MSKFQREERYIVVKLKDLTPDQEVELGNYIVSEKIPTRECVVVEPDWPIYEETWENVQRCAEGRPSIRVERDAIQAKLNRLREAFTEITYGGYYLATELEDSISEIFDDEDPHG